MVELVPLYVNTHYNSLVNVTQMLISFHKWSSSSMRQEV
jgi:hypothetical protein